MSGAPTLNVPGHVGPGDQQQRLDRVAGVQELQPGVETHHPRDHRHRQIAGHLRVHARAHQVGQPQRGHHDIRPTAGEPAYVALDLHRVLAEAGTRLHPGQQILGELGRITRGGAVDRHRTLHHELAEAVRLLARRQQLHGADDVDLFHRRPPTGPTRRGHHRHMHHGVDLVGRDHLGDDRIADIGSDERRATQVVPRRNDVDADHAVVTIGRQRPGEPRPQIPGNPGDEDNLRFGHPCSRAGGLLARAAALDTGALEQLAMLLLRHPLAALLDDRTHDINPLDSETRSRSRTHCSRRRLSPDN